MGGGSDCSGGSTRDSFLASWSHALGQVLRGQEQRVHAVQVRDSGPKEVSTRRSTSYQLLAGVFQEGEGYLFCRVHVLRSLSREEQRQHGLYRVQENTGCLRQLCSQELRPTAASLRLPLSA